MDTPSSVTQEMIGGRKVLRYPVYYEYVAYFGFLITAVCVFLATKADLAFLGIGAFFGAVSLFLFFMRRNSIILYDDSGVTSRNTFGYEKTLYWRQIVELKYDAVQGYLRLKGSDKTVSVNYIVVGFQDFLGKLRQNLNASLLSDLDRFTPKFRIQPHFGVSTEPIVAPKQGLEEKEAAAKLLVGLAFFQFIVALITFGVAFYNQGNASARETALIFSSTFLMSSLGYVIAGTLLYTFNSRVIAVAITIFALWNMVAAFMGGAKIGALFIYLLILWSCGRATYAIFLIHKNWPEQITQRSKFPKWFMVLYGLMFGGVVLAVTLIYGANRLFPATYYTCEDGSGFYARVFDNGNLQIDTDEGATYTYPIDNSTSTTVFIYGDDERGYTFTGPGQIISTKRGESPTSTICTAQPTELVWQRYDFPLFSVELPKQPTDAKQTGRYATDRGFSEYHVYTSQNDPNLIAIDVGEYLPSVDVSSPDALFDDSLDTIKSINDVSIATTSRFVHKGNKAMRIEYTDPANNQSTKAVFIFWDGSNAAKPSRYYTVSELTFAGEYDDEDFERLLDTFEVK